MTVPQNNSRRKSQRGMVLMTMAVTAIAMIGAMGLAIDLGHIFIVKNETQAYVDAAAIAAALQLDGTTAGITRANDAATNMSAAWNFSSTVLTSPTVEFSSAATGASWFSATNVTSPSTMTYARVTKTVAPNIYFVPVVMTNKVYTQNVQSQAVAGQVVLAANTSIAQGLGPFTGIAACSGDVSACEASASNNFGLTVGNEYDIQWPQYNANRQGCNNGNPASGNEAKCFVRPPCAGDLALMGTGADPMQEVVKTWGPSTNGYWGSQSTSQINKYILDQQQLAPVAIGTDITQDLSAGNKQGTSKILDDRVNQDTVNFDVSGIGASSNQKLADYLNSANQNPVHNGRRLMPVPIVYPYSATPPGISPVVGYGLFLLESNQSTAGGTSTYYKAGTGNDPYCAIYAGPWNMGSTNGGVSSSGGATRVRLVQ